MSTIFSGHYPLSYFCFLKQNVLETGSCIHLDVEPIQLGPIDKASPYFRAPAPTQDRIYIYIYV
jgi:hypothetical protein